MPVPGGERKERGVVIAVAVARRKFVRLQLSAYGSARKRRRGEQSPAQRPRRRGIQGGPQVIDLRRNDVGFLERRDCSSAVRVSRAVFRARAAERCFK